MAEGYLDFVAGATLTAANLEDYCELQGILRFADASARNTALSGVLTEGLMAYVKDTNMITVYTGSAWSTIGPVHGTLASWTPTWTNLTVGNGSVSALYSRLGRMVFCTLSVTFGSTSSISGDVGFTLPVNSIYGAGAGGMGTCGFWDDNASLMFAGVILTKDTDEANIRYVASGQYNALSSTSPFTWTTNDRIRSMFFYVTDSDA